MNHFLTGQNGEASVLIERHHYAGTFPAAPVLVGSLHAPGGLFGDQGPMLACCVYAYPPTRWSEDVIELVRLCRTPAASVRLTELIARTTDQCRRLRLADLVVSFADASHGHHGGVYQAASWRYHGQRDPQNDAVIVDGQRIPRRSAYALYGTSSASKIAERLGRPVHKSYDRGKHLYWRALTRFGRYKARRLELESHPYPKPDHNAACAI